MYLFCFAQYLCSVLNSILSKPRRGVSEAEEMLVTQMSNVARNEIATPLPHWKYNSNISTNIYHIQSNIHKYLTQMSNVAQNEIETPHPK